ISFDAQTGFSLNGKSYPLRGVSRHQDRQGLRNALTDLQHEEDMALIREIGANTVRLAHYQHAQKFYNLCDENGIIAWAEIPYITAHMANGRVNTLSQMRELVCQNYNHPSIVCWGLSNEITASTPVDDDLLENHRLLNDLCHELDATRPTTMANVFMLESDSPILEIPDINSYNLYFGWYLGDLAQNDSFFDEYHARYPDRIIGFSEYGAGATPA
ncbi:MAG: glycoside hydrolase family 2 protein, partial [Lachnospiraceae bacterium]|nr:glycoside hydrolase family 2 protein [Lachnospiraceae bacterium]